MPPLPKILQAPESQVETQRRGESRRRRARAPATSPEEQKLDSLTEQVARDLSTELPSGRRGVQERQQRSRRREELAELRPPDPVDIPLITDIPESQPAELPQEPELGTPGAALGELPGAGMLTEEAPSTFDPETAPIEEGGGRITYEDGTSATLLASGEIISGGEVISGPFRPGPPRTKSLFVEQLDTEFGKNRSAAETLIEKTTEDAVKDLEIKKRIHIAELGSTFSRQRQSLEGVVSINQRIRKGADRELRMLAVQFGGKLSEQADREREKRAAQLISENASETIVGAQGRLDTLRATIPQRMSGIEEIVQQEVQNLQQTATLQIRKQREAVSENAESRAFGNQIRITRRKLGEANRNLGGALKAVSEGRDFEVSIGGEDLSQIFIINKDTGEQVSEEEFIDEGLDLESRRKRGAIDRSRRQTRLARLNNVKKQAVLVFKLRDRADREEILLLSPDRAPPDGYDSRGGDFVQTWIADVRGVKAAQNVSTQEAIGLLRGLIDQNPRR